MGFLGAVRHQFTPTRLDSVDASPHGQSLPAHGATGDNKTPAHDPADDDDNEKQLPPVEATRDAGVSAVEAAQAVWGKKGRILTIVGLCLVMVI